LCELGNPKTVAQPRIQHPVDQIWRPKLSTKPNTAAPTDWPTMRGSAWQARRADRCPRSSFDRSRSSPRAGAGGSDDGDRPDRHGGLDRHHTGAGTSSNSRRLLNWFRPMVSGGSDEEAARSGQPAPGGADANGCRLDPFGLRHRRRGRPGCFDGRQCGHQRR